MKKARQLAVLSALTILVGCSPQPDGETLTSGRGSDAASIKSAAQLNAAGETPEIGEDTFSPSDTVMDDLGRSGDATRRSRTESSLAPPPGDAEGLGGTSIPPASPMPIAEVPTPQGEPDVSQPMVPDRKLRSDLSLEELERFLEYSDRELKLIASGKVGEMSQVEAVQMMRQIEGNKLQASLQLKNHADATDRQRVDGARGQLQSLSHLAAMGDLASANALRLLARENLSDADPGIVMDSRIVLIGFEIDALQAGESEAADRMVELVKALGQHDSVDIPAILTMGQARQVLSSYGQVEQAKAVREHILKLYGNSSDAMIAKVAAEAAGTVKFDSAERLVRAIIERDDVSLAFWSDAAIELTTESPDMSVVQYLAGAALRFEAGGRDAFVDETFRILEEQFTEPGAATTREVVLAKSARQARRDVIGRLFDPELPTVDGSDLSMQSYRGKIVLMPFWAISVPESLQIVGQLRAIREKHPDEVAIVGMNLDTADAPLPEFLAATDLEFKSYRSVSSAEESGANPVAERFGLVSLPFVVVMDKEARVVALDFTGTKIQSVVDELLK